jgi:hypothetical protein
MANLRGSRAGKKGDLAIGTDDLVGKISYFINFGIFRVLAVSVFKSRSSHHSFHD